MELDGFYHPTHPLFELQLELVESGWALRLTERWIWMDENRPLWRHLFGPVLLPPWRQIDRRARIKRERTRAACLIAAAHDRDPHPMTEQERDLDSLEKVRDEILTIAALCNETEQRILRETAARIPPTPASAPTPKRDEAGLREAVSTACSVIHEAAEDSESGAVAVALRGVSRLVRMILDAGAWPEGHAESGPASAESAFLGVLIESGPRHTRALAAHPAPPSEDWTPTEAQVAECRERIPAVVVELIEEREDKTFPNPGRRRTMLREVVTRIGRIVRAHPAPSEDGDRVEWRCESCGEAFDQMSSAWRVGHHGPEHRCQGLHPQAGHLPARYVGGGVTEQVIRQMERDLARAHLAPSEPEGEAVRSGIEFWLESIATQPDDELVRAGDVRAELLRLLQP